MIEFSDELWLFIQGCSTEELGILQHKIEVELYERDSYWASCASLFDDIDPESSQKL